MKKGIGGFFGGRDKEPLHQMAMWLAFLLTLLCTPRIWEFSGWLSVKLLEPDFGYDLTLWLRPVVFLFLLMAAIYGARATLASSVVIAAFFVATKLPIF